MSGRKVKPEGLRSRQWFNNPDDAEMTALYTERYLNYGLTREELRDGRPIIALAQTGSDLSPCNRHHLELAKRVRDGIIAAGGLPIEIPVHPIQETGKRPTAMLDRNLAYLCLVETLYGYPIDGVVLMIGSDKKTPALLMAAATVDIPAIALSVGPMLNGWHEGKRTGSGTIIWKARQMIAAGVLDALLALVRSDTALTTTARRLALVRSAGVHDEGRGLRARSFVPTLEGGIRTAVKAWCANRAAAKARNGPIAVGPIVEEPQLINEDISRWDGANVTSLEGTFANGDLSRWDVSNFTSLNYTFHRATSFNGGLSRWDVADVKKRRLHSGPPPPSTSSPGVVV